MRIIDHIHCKAPTLNTFQNFYCSQKEIELLRAKTKGGHAFSAIITGKFGSGLSHFLHAVCNEGKNTKKTAYISAPWLVYGIKKATTEEMLSNFEKDILEYDLLIIDTIQFLNRKKRVYTEFLKRIISSFQASNKQIILGFNSENGTLNKSQKTFYTTLEKIELKALSSYDVFNLLKSLCSEEDGVHDNLIYYLSGFNGSIRTHINCLISLRFKNREALANASQLNFEELERTFNISTYYPKQQLRRGFRQLHFEFQKISALDQTHVLKS